MSGAVTALAADYIALRRRLGYRSPSQERALRGFARDLDNAGQDGPISLETSLSWAAATSSTDRYNPARRLASVRGFLRHLAAVDGVTEVPAAGVLGSLGHRIPPHVYSDREIGDLLQATAGLVPVDGLRPHCYATLFALLACTGLRISEAVALTCADVDLTDGMLTVRAGKRGRTRLVPLHPSALEPLQDYATDRSRLFGHPADDAAFFRTDRSERVSCAAAEHAFRLLRHQLGWTDEGRTRTPRVHDLRHRMAVRRIQSWHTAGVNVDSKIAALATYLGHADVRELYWYLSAVPELMSVVGDRFEAFAQTVSAGAP